MSPRLEGRCFLWLLSCSIVLAVPACQTQEEPAASAPRDTGPSSGWQPGGREVRRPRTGPPPRNPGTRSLPVSSRP